MLDIEFNYYKENQKELSEKFLGKFIIIINKTVVDVYNDHVDAYQSAIEKYGLGKFLLQHCLPGELNISRTFHSQVVLYE
jgi:hypothetical protein